MIPNPMLHPRAPGALLVAALALTAGAASAAPKPIAAPPDVQADSYVLRDFDSGHLLVSHNPDQRVEPASITKIMTSYVVFQELADGNTALDEAVPISEKAWRTQGSRMFIEAGDRVSVEALLKGMIVQSGNDASVALAEHIAGSERSFASLMNYYAKELGMSDTHYVNATGLPHPEHYTTARDTAKLSAALIRQFPDYYQWYAQERFTYNDISQRNRNELLSRDPAVDGIKTGHTESAGYCLAASAKRNGMRLISVVMGAASENGRTEASRQLLSYGFRFFRTHRLYQAGETLTDLPVWKGAAEQVPLGLEDDLYVTIPRGRYESLDAEMALGAPPIAPVAAGSRQGKVRVQLDGEPVVEAPLVTLERVDTGGLWRRTVDSITLWIWGNESG